MQVKTKQGHHVAVGNLGSGMGQTQNSGDGVKASNGIFFSPGEAV
jgi:hypothetical protein